MGPSQMQGQQGPARGRVAFLLRLVTVLVGTFGAGHTNVHREPPVLQSVPRPKFGVLDEPDEIEDNIRRGHHVCRLAFGRLVSCFQGLARWTLLQEYISTGPERPVGRLPVRVRRPVPHFDLNCKRPLSRFWRLLQDPIGAGVTVQFSVVFLTSADIIIATLSLTRVTHTARGPMVTTTQVNIVLGSGARMRHTLQYTPPDEVTMLRAANEKLRLEIDSLHRQNELLVREAEWAGVHRRRAIALENELEQEKAMTAQLLSRMTDMTNQHTNEVQRLMTQKRDADERATALEHAASETSETYDKIITRMAARMQRNRQDRALRQFQNACRTFVQKQQIPCTSSRRGLRLPMHASPVQPQRHGRTMPRAVARETTSGGDSQCRMCLLGEGGADQTHGNKERVV